MDRRIGIGSRPNRRKRFCIRGHDTSIIGRKPNRACVQCERDRENAARAANPERRREQNRRAAKKARTLYPERERAKVKAWKLANPDKVRAMFLRKKWGMTPDQFDALLAKQDGGCAICGTSAWGSRGPQVDHDHESGFIRGILCVNCNVGLGRLEKHLSEARAYIESSLGIIPMRRTA